MKWTGNLLLLLVTCVVGCRFAATQSAQQLLDRQLPVMPTTKLEFSHSGINLDIRFMTVRDSTSPLHHFVFSIDTLMATLHIRGRSVFDTMLYLPIVNGSSGLREKLDTITTEGFARWSNPQGLFLDSVRCVYVATTLRGEQYTIVRDTVWSLPADSIVPFISVSPFIDAQTDTSITFALLAKRYRGFGEDYHPTSEHFRVQIFDSNNRLRFSSNEGMTFLQAIYPVEPKRPSELKRYTFEWLGYDNDGNILPQGHYTAVLSLVAKPYSYTASIAFDWKGGKQ